MKKMLSIAVILLVAAMVLFPGAAFAGASNAIHLWWTVVLPALLPFFICAQLLLELKIMHRLGKSLEWLMRPLFNLPGEAALAFVMGYCSGFPTGTAIAASLRRDGLLSQEEGARLVAFTNNPSPLFILSGVATGIFQNPAYGPLLLGINYGLNLLLGIGLGIFSGQRRKQSPPAKAIAPRAAIPPIPPFANLLKNAARIAGGNIAIVGCYLVFFSVLNQCLAESGLLALLLEPLQALGLPQTVGEPLAKGVWEMTLGIEGIGKAGLPAAQALALTAALLGFSGISVQAQVAGMVSGTDIKIKPYLFCRLAHCLLSYIVSLFLFRFISLPAATGQEIVGYALHPWENLAFCLALLVLASITGALLNRSRKSLS